MAYLLNQGFRYCVPVFIILSGVLIYNSQRYKQQSLFSFYYKRMKKILTPYLIWTLIYMLYQFRHDITAIKNINFIKLYVNNILFGYGHLYFIVIIIQMYLLYPLFQMVFKRDYEKVFLMAAFVVSLYFQLGIYLFNWEIYILPKLLFNYYYILFPAWIFYFVLGMYVIKKEPVQLNYTSLLHLLIIWLISLIVLITDSKLSDTCGSSVKPTVMFYSTASFFLLYQFSLYIEKCKSGIRRIIKWANDQSFLFYLSHILILNWIKSYVYIIGFRNIWNGLEGMCLLFFLVSMATFILIYLISFTPIVNGLGGKHAKKITNKG